MASAESAETGGEDGPVIGPCANAEEYAVEFLEQHDGAAKPAVVAAEYGCTPGHMQDVLRESDEIVRVDHGEYALSAQTDTGAEATRNGVESEAEATTEAASEATEGDRETPRPPSGGVPLSLGTDTTDPESQDGDDLVPTDEEYERQQAEIYGSDDGDEQGGDGSEVEQAVSGIGIDPRTLMTVVGVAVLLYFLYKTVIGGSSSGQAPELEEENTEPAGDEVPVDGGLLG